MRGSLLFLPLLALTLQAGFIKSWQLKETASAAVLVTGRILGVQRNERVPESQLTWKAETWFMTADVEVLHSFPSAAEIAPLPHRIEVRFLSYGPSVTSSINGYPPPLPNIAPGEILILPLQQNSSPASAPWRMMADSGRHAVIPASAGTPDESVPPPSARAFLIREFANTLSHGKPGEIAALSGYLTDQFEDLSADLMPLLSLAIGDDRQRWAEISTAMHAAQGVPRPTVADLFSAKPGALPNGPSRENLPLLQAALRKLQPSSETNDLLIKTWIANAPSNAWGSANSLIEFPESPVTTETLRQALRSDLSGSSYIAMVLAAHGNNAILPEAVDRAFRVIDGPSGHGSDFNEIEGAAALLRDHGSDQDLMRLAAIVRKYQTLDPRYYGALWQYATSSDNPRETRVLAVVLSDRRIASGLMRYCDYALGEFDRLTKRQFDISSATIPERDAAISQALAWISTH